MAKYSVPFTADVALTKVCTVNRRRDAQAWEATAIVYGSAFGGGTVTLFVSPDAGVTKVPLRDYVSGTAVSIATAGAMAFLRLGSGGTNTDELIIYATLAGSTAPSLVLAIFDNL
jgi:hypothetical protein